MSIFSKIFNSNKYEYEAPHDIPKERVFVLDEKNNVMELEVKEDAEDNSEE